MNPLIIQYMHVNWNKKNNDLHTYFQKFTYNMYVYIRNSNGPDRLAHVTNSFYIFNKFEKQISTYTVTPHPLPSQHTPSEG